MQVIKSRGAKVNQKLFFKMFFKFKHVSYPMWCYIVYHYAAIKYLMLKKVTKSESLLCCLSLLPAILLVLVNSILLAIFGSYKLFVYLCLKIWYGNKFIKFVPGPGVVTSFESRDYNHINVLARITTHLSGNQLFDEISDQVFEKFFISDLRDELCCLVRRQMGYSFMIRIRDIEIDQVFREIKTDKARLTDEELQNYLNKYCSSALPLDDELAWDLALCTTPIDAPDRDSDLKTYAILFRVSHALGDGLVLYNLLANAFTRPNGAASADFVAKLTQPNEKVNKLKVACPSHVVNALTGPWKRRELIWSENTMTSGIFISAQRNCLWKVKEIRKCFPGMTFLNVVIAAYTASLGDYFLKFHSDDVPESINIACPLQLEVGRIKRMLAEGGKNDFDNDFSAFQLICPILVEKQTKETLIQRLLIIQEEFDRVFNSFDIQYLYINFRVFVNLLPLRLVRVLFKRLFFGTMISCIPGGPKVEFFNGADLKFPVFFLSPQHAYGIALGILTYDEQMQVGFTLDGTKFDSKERVDLLVEGFFHYIDLIHEESIKRLDQNAVSRL